MKIINLIFIILLFSSCKGKQKEFTGGRKYQVKTESLEEWDKRTKNDAFRRKMEASRIDTKEMKRKSLKNQLGKSGKKFIRAKRTVTYY